MYNILKRPLITEKNTFHQEKGAYTFEVDRKATKDEIKQAVQKAFRVKVLSVRTMVCRGRARRIRNTFGRVPYWKKAVIQLAPGEKISLFEGV